MEVKEHYDQHLARIYEWMMGDFTTRTDEFKKFLNDRQLLPQAGRIALDLGAGHGIQSIPLAQVGYNVVAVDFSKHLLERLKVNAQGLQIETVHDDIRYVDRFAKSPELIVCCGDTLTHLATKQEVLDLLTLAVKNLDNGGNLLLSFRDYYAELSGTRRFIPVKSDGDRILTCVLEYGDDTVRVTDLLYERTGLQWHHKVSTYNKVKIAPQEVLAHLEKNGLTIRYHRPSIHMTTIVAAKP